MVSTPHIPISGGETPDQISLNAPARCQYRNDKLPEYQCHYPLETSGFCVFHTYKFTKEEKQGLSESERTQAEFTENKFLSDFYNLINSAPSVDFLDFRGFDFPWLNLKAATFTKPVDFRYAKFNQGVEFGNNVVFEQAAYFGGAKFTTAFFYGQKTFNNTASFDEATFSQKAYFNHVSFEGMASFIKAKFPKLLVSFDGSSFNHKAYFTETTFGDASEPDVDRPTSFNNVKFIGGVDFSRATFNLDVEFKSSEFNSEANFAMTTFNFSADFSLAAFGGRAKFWQASFVRNVSFRSATVDGIVEFIGFRDNKCFQEKCDFMFLHLSKDAILRFESVNLSNATFRYTNLETIYFGTVEWYRPKHKFKTRCRTRPRLLDEVEIITSSKRSEEMCESIADNYRQLVLNNEKKRNYDLAEDFHIGEMEMRRKKFGVEAKHDWWWKVRRKFNAYFLYRVLSNYGSSYVKAFIVLIFMFMAFSLFFLLAGFRPSKENITNATELGTSESPRVIEYEVSPDDTHKLVPLRDLLSDYGKASMFSLSVITFQRDRFYEPVGWQSQLCLYMAVLFMAAQAALVLLAVRRQFRR